MTMSIKRAYNECDTPQQRPHIALSICTLLFLNGIAGILLIVATVISPQPVVIYPSNTNNGSEI
jgi:hypothetical protein